MSTLTEERNGQGPALSEDTKTPGAPTAKEGGLTAAEEREFQQLASAAEKTPSGDSDLPYNPDDGNRWWTRRRRNVAVGGGLIGGALLTGLVGLLSIGSGPLKFLHIAQMLTSADWASLQDEDDESVLRMYRYVRALNQGTPENTRLNALGNKFADRYEARLNSVGITSAYTNVFGYFDGYALDRSHPDFRGLNDQQIRTHLEEKYNIPKDAVINGSDLSSNPEARGKVVVDARKLGFFKNKKFLETKLRQAGVSKLTSASGARILTTRAGVTLHPLKKLDEKLLRGVEDAFNKAMRERRNNQIRKGSNQINVDTKPGGETEEQKRAASQNADAARNSANEVINEGKQTDAALREGKGNPLSSFRNSLSAKITLGGASAASVPCLLRAIDDESGEVERTNVTLPLMRQSVEFIALGSQIQSGHDFDGRQLEYYDKLLSGTDSSGQKTSFSDAQSIKAIDGKPNEGVPPDETLRSIGKGTPFSFLNEGSTAATLDVICSAAVQTGFLVVSFIGGPITAAFSTVVSYLTLPHIISAAANWLSGNAINIDACCAEKGSQLRFGSRLAANDQAAASGGRNLTPDEEKEIIGITSQGIREDFSEKNLAYRLFNPYDYRTPVARFIDRHSSQSFAQTMSDAFNSLANMGNLITGNVANLVSGRTYAATTYYEFPFPKVGFTPREMNDARFQNPYTTSAEAARLFDGPNGKTYIDRMLACSAVTIGKDNQGKWNATSSTDRTPTLAAMKKPECTEQSYDWLLTRFFVKYTLNMNSLSCLEGDDESCAYIGFANG